ncbi:hypothetical protein DEO72_LG1g2754 [Vigna unguiculata]|uniref:Uncharacterized protein n=1 Tax=Vigna unguiculata TaxID=3917 RepID=A0A4D6KRD3_VIGUN|nr:hypothetical protein DEO72_LG1g2754 [Vigna unguiculata]
MLQSTPLLGFCLRCYVELGSSVTPCDCYRRTVARPVNLAQASQSRLGEMNRELAQDFCAKGHPGDQLGFLSE